MSESTERKRKLTKLRVQKCRAIKKELSKHPHRNNNVQDPADQNVTERNEVIAPDGECSEDMYNVDDNEQASTGPDRSSISNSVDDVDDIDEPVADPERSSGTEDNFDDRLSNAHSEDSNSCDTFGVDLQYKREVEEIRGWAVRSNVTLTDLDSLLKILRRRLLPQLPKSSKIFLKTGMAKYNIVDMEDCGGETGQYVYVGIAEGLNKYVNAKLHKVGDALQLQFNIDGMPMAKSSFAQVWPILCKIFHDPDIYTPFPVAIYCGASKPKCMDNYLAQFIEEMNTLCHRGIVIAGKRLEVRIHSFICDTPARAMLKCIKGHTGFHACERCNVEGFKMNGTTVFPSVHSEERTDETFRNQDHSEHHNGHSALLLLQPPIDLIKLFILDSMHLMAGQMKKLITYWVSGKLLLRLPYSERFRLSGRLEYLKSFVPCEFQRKPRAVKYIAKWKATELRFFLLYCGPIVLKGILSEKLYKHFLLLHVASRILYSSELALKRNEYARIYLRSFFLALEEFYGSESQVMNAHNLIHVADDVSNMQCELSRISAFPFENMLSTVIKKCIRTQNRPLAQICRRLHERESIRKKVMLPPVIEILKWEENEEHLHNSRGIRKIKFKGFTLSKKAPDNKVLLTTGEVLKIDQMHCAANDMNNITIRGSVWRIKNPIFTYPCNSKQLKMWELMNKPSLTKISCNINRVSNKMIMVALPLVKHPNGATVRYDKKFIMPLLHS